MKIGPFQWALYDWCPYKLCVHRGATMVRTWGEDGCLPAKERGLRRNQTCPPLDLGFLVSRTMRKSISVV